MSLPLFRCRGHATQSMAPGDKGSDIPDFSAVSACRLPAVSHGLRSRRPRDLCQDPSLSKVAGPAYPGGIHGGEEREREGGVSTTTYSNASARIGISRTTIDAQYGSVCLSSPGLTVQGRSGLMLPVA